MKRKWAPLPLVEIVLDLVSLAFTAWNVGISGIRHGCWGFRGVAFKRELRSVVPGVAREFFVVK